MLRRYGQSCPSSGQNGTGTRPMGKHPEEKQRYNFCGSPAGGPSRMGNVRKRQVLAVVTLLFVFAWRSASFAQSAPATETQVVMLGTGTPGPDPQRSGPSTAIVVNDMPYIVDAGTGVVRRAAAARDKGMKALEPTSLRIAFLTHLHADHTLGLPDLILTPWIMGRKEPLGLYVPAGPREMVENILQAYDVDIKVRTEGLTLKSHRLQGQRARDHAGRRVQRRKHYCESLQCLPWLAEEHVQLSI